jgi:hypothetical protein
VSQETKDPAILNEEAGPVGIHRSPADDVPTSRPPADKSQVRARTLPFSQRARCSIEEAGLALGVGVERVHRLLRAGKIFALSDGSVEVASVLDARSRLTRAELECEI